MGLTMVSREAVEFYCDTVGRAESVLQKQFTIRDEEMARYLREKNIDYPWSVAMAPSMRAKAISCGHCIWKLGLRSRMGC